jgi:hypothetical protein
MPEEEVKEADTGGELFKELRGELRSACDLKSELREREKGLKEKRGSKFATGAVWGLERRGGAELRQSAPSPTPSMVNFPTENGNMELRGVMDDMSKLVR